MPRQMTLKGSSSTARRISAVDSSKRPKVLTKHRMGPTSLGWCRRTRQSNLEFACGFRPVVVVRERDRTQQEVRIGLERVELQGSSRGAPNRGCDGWKGSGSMRRRLEINET